MSIGKLFVSIFRWLLLLLVALAIEKSLDALVSKVTSGHAQVFSEYVVKFPLDSHFDLRYLHFSSIHMPFVCGILAILVIFMILFRYFLCLIEPVTEVCRNDGTIDFSDVKWQERLDNVSQSTIFLVICASMFEFLFLIQAALALPDTKQWLTFLAFLTLVDLCLFILRPSLFWLLTGGFLILATTVVSMVMEDGKGAEQLAKATTHARLIVRVIKTIIFLIVLGVLIFINIFICSLFSWRVLWIIALLVLSLIDIYVIGTFILCLLSETRRNAWIENSLEMWKQRSENLAKEWAGLYLKWDLLDLAVVAAGGGSLWLGFTEETAVFLVFALTLSISIWNIQSNQKVYREHLAVLTFG